MIKTLFKLCLIPVGILLIGCGSQNENLAKGKELIKSEKRNKEARAVERFKTAIVEEPDNAEAHYLLGHYDSEDFYAEDQTQAIKKASIKERGKHMFIAYQNDKRKYLEILVFETLRHQSREVQEAALEALNLVYTQGDRNDLLKALKKAIKSKDNRDRHDAQLVMGSIAKQDPDTIMPILEELMDYKRMETRLNVVKAFGEIGDERAIPMLVTVINSGSAKRKKDREASEVRRLAVEALGKIGGSAVQELVQIVENKGSAMRVDAIQALEKLGDEKAVKPLLDVLGEQGSREVVAKLR